MAAPTEPKKDKNSHPPRKRYPRFNKSWVLWTSILFILGWAAWTMMYPFFV